MTTRMRLLLLLLLLPVPMSAQTGAVTGTALDSNSNIVAGASIVVCPQGSPGIPCSPVIASTTSNGQGAFSVTVPIGTYQVTVFRIGIIATSSTVVVAPSNITVSNNVTYNGAVTFTGNVTFNGQITSTVPTGTAPFSIASTTNVPNLNASTLNGKTPPAGNIVGDTDAQTESNKTFDISLNTLKTATNTAGHVPRNNGTKYIDGQLGAADLSDGVVGSGSIVKAAALQGTDTNVLTAGTVSASTGVALCTDANHGATTSGCTAGGVSEATMGMSFGFGGGSATCSTSSTSNGCVYYFLANAHTLTRVIADTQIAPSGCSTAPQVGVRDVTASSNLSSLTPSATGTLDSGALSVSMTAGHIFSVGITVQGLSCSTFGAFTVSATYQ